MSNFVSKLKSFKWKKYINYVAISIVILVFGGLSLAGGLPASTVYLLEKIAISIILAVSLSLVVGFLGELSLGHAGFMCVGAYLGGKVAAMLAKTAIGDVGKGILVLIIALIVGGACAGLCGFIVGLPALRLKGDYLAIVTLAFGEIVKVLFQNSSAESFGGPIGLSTPRFDKKYLFIIGFLVVLLTLAVIQNLIKSKHGRAITAIRDNEIAAKSTGINVTKYKLTGFIIAAVFAGLAGVIFSYSQNNISSATFDYNYSIEILVMVVLGGMGNINGSIISATLITFLNVQLQNVLKGDLAVLKDLLYALILILLVIYNNAPALKNFREKYNLGNLWHKIFKPKHDPANARDDAARWDVVPTKISMDEVLSTDVLIDTTGDNSADIGERGGNK
ncbi:MAG: branched-chain amino acid ABC transporter permease [Ruminococcaceae bacterium]|nr:branched-chain amino acid ABC transporter permease [Oscillospiraceae bacterium]